MKPRSGGRVRVLLICLLPMGCAGAADRPPPNIVLIISDDQAWSDYGFMGHARAVEWNI